MKGLKISFAILITSLSLLIWTNSYAACTYGSGSIDSDPNTPYCMASSGNACCVEKPPGGEL